MKVSLITATYNSAHTIADCLESIHRQSYRNIEHIVIDGLSKDNTLEIVENHKIPFTTVFSGKDKGIYDAMNKGLQRATGDIIGILNSDDFYADEAVIADVVKAFEDPSIDAVYGDLVYVDSRDTSRQLRYWKSGLMKPNSFLKGWMPPHPTFFVRKKLYEQYGGFETSLKSAADYELMLRFLYRYKVKAHYIPRVLVRMRVGGISNKSLLNRLRANREDRQAWKMNGLKPRFYTLYMKPLSKIFQFFEKNKGLHF